MDPHPRSSRELGWLDHRAELRAGGRDPAAAERSIRGGFVTPSMAPTDVEQVPRARIWVAAMTAMAVLVLSVIAGLASSGTGGGPVTVVDRISTSISAIASGAGSRVWWTYAFLLGAVAAFNPCGFALLPAYLGLYVSEKGRAQGVATRARHALLVSFVVASSFTILFGAIGAVFELGSSLIVRLLPWVGVGVGGVLMVVGGVWVAGGSLVANLP